MSYHCCLSSLMGQYTGISNVIVQAVKILYNILVKMQCIVGASLNINALRTNACTKKYMHKLY